ncbi:MAG TPA: metalloregulator ArsR/SmtB family transcription factor [Roseiflexaceae bacterium]|nr:metalloregulator ArsR/SmtB family transcription factor [Roseiflexaceae bacterium]
MTTSPFGFVPRVQANTTITHDPVLNALMTLVLLNADLQQVDVEDWFYETLAALTPDQRRRNRLVFDVFGAALVPAETYPDFPSYLSALEALPATQLRDRLIQALIDDRASVTAADLLDDPQRIVQLGRLNPGRPIEQALALEAHRLLNDPPALQDLIVAHLYDMWENVLGAEWERLIQKMAAFRNFLEHRPLPARSVADSIRAFINRELPDTISAQLAGVRQVVFVLSPYIRLHAARFGSDTTIWVFVMGHFTALPLRAAPIKRAELIRPLTALADDTRLHILELLVRHEELPTQEIIAQLDQSQPNVSRHLKQLVAAGFVEELRGDGAHKRYRLHPRQVDSIFWTLRQLLSPENARETEADARAGQPVALQRFLDPSGRVTMWPAKRQAQDQLLTYLASKFEHDRQYTEREVNELLNQWHTYKDHATLRRDLYDARLLDRTPDGARYWRVPEAI